MVNINKDSTQEGLYRKKKSKFKKRYLIVLCIVIIAALFLFKIYFLDNQKDSKRDQEAIEHVDEQNDSKIDFKSNKKAKNVVSNSKSNIKGINWRNFSQDTIAVLEIPNMLEYPVVQGKDNSYYLHRDLDRTYKYSGTLFVDANNASDFTDDNTIIYGHNMTSGRMFGSLKKFKSKSFLNDHKYFFVHLRGDNGQDEILKYEIKNVCVVNLGSRIYTLQFGDDFTQYEYIKMYHGLFDNKLDYDKKICTLSTCTNFGRQRLCVQGSLISRVAK